MNSYQNKKRKRNLVKKAKKKQLLSDRFLTSKWLMSIIGNIPKAIDNLPQFSLTEEQLEILKRRATV
jgi:hypothetical protein